MKQLIAGMAALLLAIAAVPAQAALNNFMTFNGNVGLSTDGFGSLSNTGNISAEVPTGATVLGAYLYTATFQTTSTPTVELGGTAVTFGPRVANATACCSLASFRADVTSLVKPTIDGGAGGIYDFDIAETGLGNNTDGSALVVVYEHASLPDATVGLLDGFASVTGDTTSINFADPLDPTDPEFFAEMRLGISFSCCDQKSRVEVNGNLLTENAGNMDDGDIQDPANGRLITMGGFDDAFSPTNPSYADDTERYNLAPFASKGDTSFTIDTFNASRDDNIFLAAFHVRGEAGINEPPPSNDDPVDVPEPAGFMLLLTGLAGLTARRFLHG